MKGECLRRCQLTETEEVLERDAPAAPLLEPWVKGALLRGLGIGHA